MAFDYDSTFKRIISKATLLEERYRKLLESRDRVRRENDELKAKVAKQDAELEKLRREAEYLRVASTLAPSRQQVEATKAMIAGLVRDIDRCITELSD